MGFSSDSAVLFLLNKTRGIFFSIFLIRLFRKTRYLLCEYKVKINIDEVKKMRQMKYLILPLTAILLASCAGPKGLHYLSGVGVGAEGAVPYEGIETKIPAGQLTCAALDDNKYYDFWKQINSQKQSEDEDEDGPLYECYEVFGSSFSTMNRIKLTVNNGNDVYVTLKEDNLTYHVDNMHTAYLFAKSKAESYEVDISYLNNSNERVTMTTVVQDEDTIDLENTFTLFNQLEIMFVIDATGSMGDEMQYIQSEIVDVIEQVKNSNAGINIKLAMMVYRDSGDDYVTKYSDFTANISSQQTWLNEQSSDGGGDYEEAVDVALTEAMNKQWSTKATKLLFHVADAPSHDQDVPTWANAAYSAANKGIKIISVAASGFTQKAEFFFRSQSLLTGGQYVFLTDDSGIGNKHEQPTIQEPLVVEYLNACLVRLINGYQSGVMADPVPYNQGQE